jgi:hypothetical protein
MSPTRQIKRVKGFSYGVLIYLLAMSKLIIEVSEIRGKCPVHKVGDKIVIDGP